MLRVVEEIQAENNWRDAEFSKFKTKPHQVDEVIWNRMCIPMIYAHWEGFVVSSLKILISALNKQSFTSKEVNTKLIVLSLNDQYSILSGKQSFNQRIRFTDAFEEAFMKNISIKSQISTKSNLRPDVFEEICEVFDFDKVKFLDFSSDIQRLVNLRNAIAHGENSIVPTSENIQKYIKTVQDASDYLLSEIDCYVKKKKYLKVSLLEESDQ